ncbi:TPA: hypothetical protein DEB29_03550 [Candidatus Wolfebacteria bacterium]|nr:hypothetical protein [Candidatus Wolfebacteria bacterium]
MNISNWVFEKLMLPGIKARKKIAVLKNARRRIRNAKTKEELDAINQAVEQLCKEIDQGLL